MSGSPNIGEECTSQQDASDNALSLRWSPRLTLPWRTTSYKFSRLFNTFGIRARPSLVFVRGVPESTVILSTAPLVYINCWVMFHCFDHHTYNCTWCLSLIFGGLLNKNERYNRHLQPLKVIKIHSTFFAI